MRLFRPNPGECVDRQTILELKAEHVQSLDPQRTYNKDKIKTDDKRIDKIVFEGASRINIKPFLDEHDEIQVYLEKNWFPEIASSKEKQKQFDVLYAELAEVNGQLWKLEDQVRIYLQAPMGYEREADIRSLEVYRTITTLNNKRSELVKQVNTLWGLSVIEKLY
jgi:hypothetical protein